MAKELVQLFKRRDGVLTRAKLFNDASKKVQARTIEFLLSHVIERQGLFKRNFTADS